MNFYHKNLFLKFSLSIIALLLMFITIYFIYIKDSDSQIYFENFMDSYISKNIQTANNYVLNNSLPNLNEIFSNGIKNSKNNIQNEIITLFENLFYSINYEVISSKTIFNKSIINVHFDYYDLSKHIINYFKNLNEHENNNYDNFIHSLKTTKYKISTNLNIELIKKDNQWNIVLSENLINILTSGLYKNFSI
ncbi:hypothetical protein [Candidatus Arthromitus sp. SFB-turkey]|uniref:hypothetical protein n=1 Tax=Candidatus Arthromitus sp. SFB-turkey TaxID=1840217 RepID=UPI0007F51C95|nr:hypothetical protein [Candidatus Arthromitus sp. SFB-turkey]OAT86630.1 hypothetical protein A6P36_02695 [Candidatus Arthromitus sp. SFB-turkey]